MKKIILTLIMIASSFWAFCGIIILPLAFSDSPEQSIRMNVAFVVFYILLMFGPLFIAIKLHKKVFPKEENIIEVSTNNISNGKSLESSTTKTSFFNTLYGNLTSFFSKTEINNLKQEIEKYKIDLQEFEGLSIAEVKNKVSIAEENYNNKTETLQKDIDNYNSKISSLNNEIKTLNTKLHDLTLDAESIEFGLYIPTYECMNSDEYKDKINELRKEQKEMIKNKKALFFNNNWTLEGSKTKGAAMNNDNIKMYLRAFNNECDVLINKVKFNNYDSIQTRIQLSANSLNKLNTRTQISITPNYLMSKIRELKLIHEFNCIKQEEKEAIRHAREVEREEEKLQKELEEARKNITKELSHYSNARDNLLLQLESATPELIEDINAKISEIDTKLNDINKNLSDIDYREANQRAGYVYVISNIGSFGEGIYKIGMTRRLEPMDRVHELGDASVPFTFDVHAMIFSDDAPKLESSLHTAFEDKKVNLLNGRKEFFRVSLDEIEEVIKNNHDKLIEFNKVALAEQYRETQQLLATSPPSC